jgi:hypothetical protein
VRSAAHPPSADSFDVWNGPETGRRVISATTAPARAAIHSRLDCVQLL